MSKGVAVVAGYGRGISHAVATKLGREGFKVALLSRTQSKLDAAAEGFSKEGVVAKGYAVDLSIGADIKSTLSKIRADLGPTTILHWNAYGGASTFQDTTQEKLVHEYNTAVAGLVSAVQEVQEDLKSQAGQSAVWVTGGALALENDATVDVAIKFGTFTLALSKATQRKLVHLLNKQLGEEGIYTFEVSVGAAVKGTAFDFGGTATLTPETIADKFWELYTKRDLAIFSEVIA